MFPGQLEVAVDAAVDGVGVVSCAVAVLVNDELATGAPKKGSAAALRRFGTSAC